MVDIAGFISKWGLDATAHQALAECPTEVQARVVVGFQPKPDTRDVNQLFRGFLRSIRGGPGGKGGPGLMGGPPPGAPPVASPGSPTIVAATGRQSRWDPAPPVQVQGDPTTVEGFLQRWALDENAAVALRALDPTTQQRVLKDFKPKFGTRDVNRLFQGFLRSVREGPPSAPKLSAQEQVRAIAAQWSAPGGAFGQDGGAATPAEQWPELAPIEALEPEYPQVPIQPARVDPEEIREFMAQWGLDATCMEVFSQLDTMSQIQAMNDFAPKGDAHSVSQAFHALAKSVAERSRAELAVDAAAFRGFVQAWSLNESSQVAFMQLKPELQHQVMRDFGPKPDTPDVNQVFNGFVRSIRARALAAEKHGLSLFSTDPWAGQAVEQAKRGFQDDEPGPTQAEISNFMESWGMPAATAAALEGLSGSVQWRALREFRPKEGTRDITTLFHGFVRSVARGPQPAKRPRSEQWGAAAQWGSQWEQWGGQEQWAPGGQEQWALEQWAPGQEHWAPAAQEQWAPTRQQGQWAQPSAEQWAPGPPSIWAPPSQQGQWAPPAQQEQWPPTTAGVGNGALL